MSTLNKEIGRRIALLRLENHITQEQLAEALRALCPILSTDLDFLVRGEPRCMPDESKVPSFVIELFNTKDMRQKELLEEYLILFKKILYSGNANDEK